MSNEQAQNPFWVISKGFSNVAEAESFFKHWDINPEKFIYVSVDGGIYAASMENLADQVVVTKEQCYMRKEYNSKIIDFSKLKRKDFPALERPRISRPWDDQYRKELEAKHTVRVEKTGAKCKATYLEGNVIILIACLLNGTAEVGYHYHGWN